MVVVVVVVVVKVVVVIVSTRALEFVVVVVVVIVVVVVAVSSRSSRSSGSYSSRGVEEGVGEVVLAVVIELHGRSSLGFTITLRVEYVFTYSCDAAPRI